MAFNKKTENHQLKNVPFATVDSSTKVDATFAVIIATALIASVGWINMATITARTAMTAVATITHIIIILVFIFITAHSCICMVVAIFLENLIIFGIQ